MPLPTRPGLRGGGHLGSALQPRRECRRARPLAQRRRRRLQRGQMLRLRPRPAPRRRRRQWRRVRGARRPAYAPSTQHAHAHALSGLDRPEEREPESASAPLALTCERICDALNPARALAPLPRECAAGASPQVPDGGAGAAWVAELVATFLLVTVVLQVCTPVCTSAPGLHSVSTAVPPRHT